MIAAVAALPRLVALLYERSDITSAFIDKGDVFARTFVASGTYGFVPSVPSAYTQPLYGFFLVPLYWIFDRSWVTVGLAHIAVAVGTAWLVYELGRYLLSPGAGMLAAVVATIHPYLVWHDVHMNREILDGFLAVAVVLLTLLAADRRSLPLAAAAGAVLGVAILGNVRLIFLPLVLLAYLLWRRSTVLAGVVLVAAAGIVVVPWVVRNDVSVGCAAITTDARALWKANNVNTLETLRAGGWIDDVPPIPGAPPSPQDAWQRYRRTGELVRVDECAQMRFYRSRALDFMADHPGEKLLLAGWGAKFLWQPWVPKTEGRPGRGTWLDTARAWAEPLYAIVVFAFGLAGCFFLPRRFVVLAVALLAYQTVMAMVFMGQTRYRVPWDFLLVVLGAGAAQQLAARIGPALRARRPVPAPK